MSYDKHAILSSLPDTYKGTVTTAADDVFDIATTTIDQELIAKLYGDGAGYELSIYGVDTDFSAVATEDILTLTTDQDTAKEYVVIGRARWAGGLVRIDLGDVMP